MVKAVISVIMRERQDPECLLETPPAPQERSSDFIVDKNDWLCMPTSKPSHLRYTAYKKADNAFVCADYHTSRLPSGLDRLKVTYGNLRRRPEAWGPHIDPKVQYSFSTHRVRHRGVATSRQDCPPMSRIAWGHRNKTNPTHHDAYIVKTKQQDKAPAPHATHVISHEVSRKGKGSHTET